MNEPIRLAVGPVLHADDAFANKVCALFGRAEIRDYVDVAAILASGRYSDDDLIRLAAAHDPGSTWHGSPRPSERSTAYPMPPGHCPLALPTWHRSLNRVVLPFWW